MNSHVSTPQPIPSVISSLVRHPVVHSNPKKTELHTPSHALPPQREKENYYSCHFPVKMMEQPTSNPKEENAVEMKSVPLEPDFKDPSPNHGPDPDPKPDGGGALKPRDNADINTRARGNSTDNTVLKGKNSGSAEEDSTEPAVEGLKTKKSVRWSQELVMESPVPRDSDRGSSNPYVNYSPAPADNSSSFNFKETMGNVKDVLGKWGKKVGEATKKAEDLAGNTWQHRLFAMKRLCQFPYLLGTHFGVVENMDDSFSQFQRILQK
ncbi:putative gem-like protein 3 [Phtheirospermum japonicum]|uniref:Putative gem-like protein 3 n=1 Tax=Phtheirospermum japonicum TaxID=374723 RepID=A0A830CBJ0_9LAMI|nr:putative gem-like protein 3 [Phtheirospermum japonicum]